MNTFKKFALNYKYRKKKFKFIDDTVDYKQFNSKFINTHNISIGKYSKILDYAYIDGKGGIDIGNCVIIAPRCTILTVNHNYDELVSEYLPFDNIKGTSKNSCLTSLKPQFS